MKKFIQKAITVLGSAALVGSTIGMAAAAAYPAPFVENGAANVAIVHGSNAAISDVVGAANVASDLATALAAQTASGGTGAAITGGDAWQAMTSSDQLEMKESLKDVESYLDLSTFSLLEGGTIVNSKGTAVYDESLYFHDTESSWVEYAEDDDADVVGDYFKIQSGQNIARYVVDFTTNLESDITSGTLDDIEDETINLLGKAYTITTATNGTAGAELTLMSGANQGTIDSGEEMTIGGYTISASVSSSTAVEFTIDGTDVDEMNKGDIEPISGTSDYIAVTDIDYESFSGGLHRATFWVGADKLVLKNGSSTEVNADSISGSDVIISSTESGGDIVITEIEINMTAQDDYLVPVDGKLSDEIELEGDERGILFGQNWDIEFKGFAAVDTDEVKLDATGSDRKYTLSFTNLAGETAELPLVYSNVSGMFGGETADKRLVLAPGADNITKNDYFILNTADPTTAGNNAKSYVVKYKGADKTSASSPKLDLEILGVGSQELSMDKTVTVGQTLVTLKLGGGTFTFANRSSCASSDCEIYLTSTDYADGENLTRTNTTASSVSNYLRTESNALINITDGNESKSGRSGDRLAVGADGAPWTVNITADDTARDDDDLSIASGAGEPIYYVSFQNGTDTTDMTATLTKIPSWISDPSDNNRNSYRTRYGALIEEVDGDDSPSEVVITLPDSIIEPLVFVSSGEISVSTGSAGGTATELGAVTVEDNEVASVASKNLIVVGGSCINSVAADLLGQAACSADFTTLTDVAAGEFLIESFDRSGKTAVLVAGYNAEDTTKAVTYLTNNAVDTIVGTKLKGTSATEATVVTA